MKISVIHPSRGRPQQAFATAKRWIEKCSTYNWLANNIEYIVSLDNDDLSLPDYKRLFGEDENFYTLLIDDNRQSAIEAINWAAQKSKGDLLVINSDDFDCPEHWDTLLLNELKGKSDFLVKTQDGIQPTLITLPIMDKVYYNRFGYVYHPDYSHMYADVELTAVGMMLGKVIKSDLLFEHKHYSTGKTPKDAINEKNDLTYKYGDEVLAKHLLNNFGIKEPLIAYQQIKWH